MRASSQATVEWGLNAGLLGNGRKVAVIAGNRASDQAGAQLLSPARPGARRRHADRRDDRGRPVRHRHHQRPGPPGRAAAASRTGSTSVIPLIPFNAFFPVLGARDPAELLSRDCCCRTTSSRSSRHSGSSPFPYEKAIDGQEGVTTETLGGIDDWRPESQGGYDPGVRSCFTTWHKAYPQIPPGNQNFFLEEQGPVQAWCQEIRLFATAATAAGRDLDRRTFVDAMAKITNFPGGFSPVLSLRPGQVLRTDRVPGGAGSTPTRRRRASAISRWTTYPQGVCWVIVPGLAAAAEPRG